MAIRTPPLSVDDQDYYPLHEEDDVPETPPHRRQITDLDAALRAYFPGWFVSGNVCLYWERGNTEAYCAPDVFVVKEPLSEPVRRVYQLWKQPPVAFAIEIASRSTQRTDAGPKVAIDQDRVQAGEYYHANFEQHAHRLWRLREGRYEEVAAEPNGRLRSRELDLEFELAGDEGLRIYTLDGELLLTHREEREARLAAEARLQVAAARLEATEERFVAAEQQAAEEATFRQAAERQAAVEAARRADLERQLAELQARLAEREPGA